MRALAVGMTWFFERISIKCYPGGLPPGFLIYLAAAAVVVAATAVVGVHQTIATAVAQEQDDQDDPANITAAETIVTHNQIPPKIFRGD